MRVFDVDDDGGFDVRRQLRLRPSTPCYARVFSTSKIVVVAHFNMDRVRLVWSRVWGGLLADFFVKAGCHRSLPVALYAIDALRQLSAKFLEQSEGGGGSGGRLLCDGALFFCCYPLRRGGRARRERQAQAGEAPRAAPSPHAAARPLELPERVPAPVCGDRPLGEGGRGARARRALRRAACRRSPGLDPLGWRSLFMALAAAAGDESPAVVGAGFACVERVVRGRAFCAIVSGDEADGGARAFPDAVNCLVALLTRRGPRGRGAQRDRVPEVLRGQARRRGRGREREAVWRSGGGGGGRWRWKRSSSSSSAPLAPATSINSKGKKKRAITTPLLLLLPSAAAPSGRLQDQAGLLADPRGVADGREEEGRQARSATRGPAATATASACTSGSRCWPASAS